MERKGEDGETESYFITTMETRTATAQELPANKELRLKMQADVLQHCRATKIAICDSWRFKRRGKARELLTATCVTLPEENAN